MANSASDPEVPVHPIPDTGAMLRAYIKKYRIYQSALGRVLGHDYRSISGYKKRHTIQTSILWELSMALKHNFFADIAAQMPPEFSTDAPADDTKDARIRALEAELTVVKAERDVLKEVLGRGA